MRTWYIYCLKDPRSGQIRYVGRSTCPKARLSGHLYEAKRSKDTFRTHKDNWLRILIASGLTPVIEILETGAGDGWQEAEIRWISHCRSNGCSLVNRTDGGDGVPGIIVSDLSRARMSEAAKARAARDSDFRNRLALYAKRNAGVPKSPEAIAKSAAARRGKRYNISPEVRSRMSLAKKGKKRSPESIERAAAKLRGKRRSIEFKQRMSLLLKSKALRVKPWTEARRLAQQKKNEEKAA